MAGKKALSDSAKKLSQLLGKIARSPFSTDGLEVLMVKSGNVGTLTFLSPEGLYSGDRQYRRYPVMDGAAITLNIHNTRMGKSGPIIPGRLVEPIKTAKTGPETWEDVELTVQDIEKHSEKGFVDYLIDAITSEFPWVDKEDTNASAAQTYEDHQHWGTW